MNIYQETLELKKHYEIELDQLDFIRMVAMDIGSLLPFENEKINNLAHYISEFIKDYYFSIKPKTEKEELKKLLRENLTDPSIPKEEKNKILSEVEALILKNFSYQNEDYFLHVFRNKCHIVLLKRYTNKEEKAAEKIDIEVPKIKLTIELESNMIDNFKEQYGDYIVGYYYDYYLKEKENNAPQSPIS